MDYLDLIKPNIGGNEETIENFLDNFIEYVSTPEIKKGNNIVKDTMDVPKIGTNEIVNDSDSSDDSDEFSPLNNLLDKYEEKYSTN